MGLVGLESMLKIKHICLSVSFLSPLPVPQHRQLNKDIIGIHIHTVLPLVSIIHILSMFMDFALIVRSIAQCPLWFGVSRNIAF